MTIASPALTAADFDDLHDFIRLQVVAGYSSVDQIVEDAVELFRETTIDHTEIGSAARGVLAAALAAHASEQESWVQPTDCDRLDAAFAELEASGIVARQHFSCCGVCGATEINHEMDEAMRAGHAARGFTFFHVQDTEHAVAGDGLYLSYGSPDRDQATAIAIGHEVVATLGRHGLAPAWNGRLAHRIQLPLTWQRRRY
jgi:hypothetical protein